MSMEDRILVSRFLLRASRSYAWSCLKNCVKILIGRKSYFDDRDLFFRQYVFHLTGFRSIRKITSPGLRGEGPGSQALMIMSAINFARASGLKYVHTPLKSILHADRPMQEWAAAWETCFNLGEGEAICDVERHEVVNYAYNFPELELCFGWHGRTEQLTKHFKNLLPEFRRKYYLDKSPHATGEVSVAVHVRRGDVTADRASHLFTPTKAILQTINAARSILNTHAINHGIGIYSEGNGRDFEDLAVPGVELVKYRIGNFADDDDNAGSASASLTGVPGIDPIEAMRALIEADVLIMAKSSFSYYAALICDGIRIYDSHFRPPMDDWLPIAPGGSFDTAVFEQQLLALIQAKANRTP